ncbi:MAG TPA: DUF4097 family beta strand repeat-containing protein [Pyrinomonadaceae bacterium]|nr:DUF4097 family beta strand repeat-containing protein [Pyrinomonadaceae bacterium]
MKNSSVDKACALLVLILGASSVWATGYQERDEINRSFTLSPTARVEVEGISGSVDISAIDGNTAIVQIERTGRSPADMDCNKVVLRQTAGNLLIKSETVGCQNIEVTHRVLVSVPRSVGVNVHGVSGPITIEGIEGALRISGNSGNINLAQSGRGSSISGNSGTTTIKLRQLDAGGLELSGHSGTIKLQVVDDLNVDVKVSGLSGTASSELPNVRFRKTGAADYHARIGSGGPTITVQGCSGSVLLSQYRE